MSLLAREGPLAWIFLIWMWLTYLARNRIKPSGTDESQRGDIHDNR